MQHETTHQEIAHPAPRQAAIGGWLRVHATALLTVALFVLALAPRTLAPGDFLTADEADHWQQRTETFVQALHTGKFERTSLTEHPGVTTMWLGAGGVLLYDELVRRGSVAPIDPAWEALDDGDTGSAAEVFSAAPADYALYRALLRLPIALISALWVALVYLLLRRLIDPRVALLAALFLAADPFLIAHGRTLHVDALLTVFMSLSLLTAMLAVRLDAPPASAPDLHAALRGPLLVASALAAGLALLTKTPAVLLVPLVGLVLLVGLVRGLGSGQWRRVLAGWLLACAVWGGVALALWVALWPALWVDLTGTIATMISEAADNSGAPHSNGSFFLGRVLGDPGTLFYPVVLVMRLTPWALLGILAAGLAWPRRVTDQRDHSSTVVVLLLVFGLLFLVALSLPAKKLDRYMLPIFPVLNIVAALGWVRLWDRLRLWLPARWHAAAAALPSAALVVLLAGTLFTYHPYYLAYYNPLLGGGTTATRTLVVGWGEGLAQAGRYIKAQPNGCDLAISSWYEQSILPYVCTPVMHLGWAARPGGVDYVVLYVNQLQREIDSDITALVQEQGSLVHTVRLHGIDYAYVYQLPRPTEYQSSARFGSAIRLTGYEFDTSTVAESGMALLTVQWQALEPLDSDLMLFIHVLDAQGNRISQTDVPPAGPDMLPSTWTPGHFYRWFHPVPLGSSAEPGRYWLAIGLYHPETFERLPLYNTAELPTNAPAYDDRVLLLGPLVLEE